MSQRHFLLATYGSLGAVMASLILLNPNRFTSIDSGYYLQSAANLLAGRGYVITEEGELIWNGIFPIGYSALIAIVSSLTGLPILVASKLVNFAAIGTYGYCWTRRLAIAQAVWVLSIWALGSFLKIAVYTWSETVFLVLLAEWVWAFHQFLLKPIVSRVLVLSLIGYSLFLIRYVGGFVFGITGLLAMLLRFFPRQTQPRLGSLPARSISPKLLLITLIGLSGLSVYFWINQQLSGSYFGGERFVSTESAFELTRIFAWALLNECLLIRDFAPTDSTKLAWVGLAIQVILFSTAYRKLRRNQLPNEKAPQLNRLSGLFILTACLYLLTLFSLRTMSPFSNPNLRLMAPFTFCFLMASLLWIGQWPVRWQKNLLPYWLALLACSWLQLLPQADLLHKISLLLNQ
ncbi:hypothetical protein [Spirosoma foliorum]|uniref:Glycosyltransferase RgtA/B/C/D-like domain-containing protein n=1 Tax=Spirosoma foliorum TaxID=2710596 RepID=A0A7G5H0B9_9BACT|nr:hypothetical protein [Spirosoma foliorum]QMW04561.1 hypothetical protein H3H32_06395 [Spirosoma foliorum]